LEIVKQRTGDVMEVRVSGRLDNHGSEPLDEALAEMIREGARHLRLDLADVNYVSSAGIGVLMNAYRDVIALDGTFRIVEASDRVRTILRLVELDTLLFTSADANIAAQPAADLPRQIESERALFECYSLDESRSQYRLLGDPNNLMQSANGFSDSATITIGDDVFAIGVGALGHNFDECRNLFGEFVAAAGSAATMPTDGTSTPDYVTRSGDFVADVQALYAIVFQGRPSHLLRFEAATGSVAFSEIVDVCAEVAGTSEFGVVMAAEVFGLVCAMLRLSPARGERARFDFPGVRDWLSFAPEHEYARNSSVVVGFASASPSDDLQRFLRPVSEKFHGHFHAIVHAFRSLRQGKVQISDVLAQTFQPRSVISVVHLLHDDRTIEGAGESEFQRGVCWVFPMTPIERGAQS